MRRLLLALCLALTVGIPSSAAQSFGDLGGPAWGQLGTLDDGADDVATGRAEVVLPVAPALGFLASDMDGDGTFNTSSDWTSAYVFPNGSGQRWTMVAESTWTSHVGVTQMQGANSASATFRPDDGVTPPHVDMSGGVNGILTSVAGSAGALDFMVDATDYEVIVAVRPLGFATIGAVVNTLNNRTLVAHDIRAADPNRMYGYSAMPGTSDTVLPARDTWPTTNGINVGSYRWQASDFNYFVAEDGTEYAGTSTTGATSAAGENQFLSFGSGFIGYYKAAVHAVLLFDRVLTTQERLDTFAVLRARFEDY